ncbi:MAG: hypothetical protein P4N59_13160 [Negativicutes bacterium]|nr:hypothetical protein [Negativicutes bacterium]
MDETIALATAEAQAQEAETAAHAAANAAIDAVVAAETAEQIAEDAARVDVAEIIVEHERTEEWQSGEIERLSSSVGSLHNAMTETQAQIAALATMVQAQSAALEILTQSNPAPSIPEPEIVEEPETEIVEVLEPSEDTPAEPPPLEEKKKRYRLL